MTPRERAEKIASVWCNIGNSVPRISGICPLADAIAAQIEEAQREAYERGVNNISDLHEKACTYDKGFRAAQEKAAEIAHKYHEEMVLDCSCGDLIAERIRKMRAE